MYLCPWFGLSGSNLVDLLYKIRRYTKSGINWLSDGLYIWVRLHLMWNVEFSTLNDMLMIWGFWSQYPWFAPMPQNLSKVSFSMKSWFKQLQWLSVYESFTLVWGIWVQSPQITSMPLVLYTRWPSNDLETWVRHHFIWNIKLKTLDYLYVPFPMALDIWTQIS